MKVFQNILSISLAALVLLFSNGMSISKHICGEKVVDTAINWDVKKCSGDDKKCARSTHQQVSKKCCSTEFSNLKSSIFLKSKVANVDVFTLVKYTLVPAITINITQNLNLVSHLARGPTLPIYKWVACFRL